MFVGLLKDAKSIYKRDPAARSTLEVILLYPGFKALFYHRFSSFFYRHKMYFIARYFSERARRKTGIEIHPGAKIGEGLFIDHGNGVVIGETAEIGNNCTIYHQVTLGGTGTQKHKKRHPTVGDNVLIGAGAKILGPVKIGNNSLIGAGSVVLNDIPDNCTVTGMKARIVKMDGQRVAPSETLEHTKVPDPINQELMKVMEAIKEREKKLQALIEELNHKINELECVKKKYEQKMEIDKNEDIQHTE
ncbi:MAG: serine O-acetyltransferase [Clostridiaceae bacterium]|nr:serine O-acetyltransferase [Clostridiaceae bacterium]